MLNDEGLNDSDWENIANNYSSRLDGTDPLALEMCKVCWNELDRQYRGGDNQFTIKGVRDGDSKSD